MRGSADDLAFRPVGCSRTRKILKSIGCSARERPLWSGASDRSGSLAADRYRAKFRVLRRSHETVSGGPLPFDPQARGTLKYRPFPKNGNARTDHVRRIPVACSNMRVPWASRAHRWMPLALSRKSSARPRSCPCTNEDSRVQSGYAAAALSQSTPPARPRSHRDNMWRPVAVDGLRVCYA